MIFRQLCEPESCTYTYLIACRQNGLAALVDPTLDTVDRDLSLLQALGLRLAYTVETHIHADHVTSAARLRSLTGCLVLTRRSIAHRSESACRKPSRAGRQRGD